MMFGSEALPENVKVHKQQGVKGCGLFAIAFVTAICFKQELTVPFNQEVMRQHLVQCFKKGACLPFPLVHNTQLYHIARYIMIIIIIQYFTMHSTYINTENQQTFL